MHAMSVYRYTGTMWANSQETNSQAREEDAASVYGYTGTVWANSEEAVGQALPSNTFVSEWNSVWKDCV